MDTTAVPDSATAAQVEAEKAEQECARLMQWMNLTGFTIEELAKQVYLRPNTLRVQVHRRRLTDTVRWRFERKFGLGPGKTIFRAPDDFALERDEDASAVLDN